MDTDKSVNTYSVTVIAQELIRDGMTDEEKLDAIYTFHRRMMHHNRTTQAYSFQQLCAAVFGWENTRRTDGSGYSHPGRGRQPGIGSLFHVYRQSEPDIRHSLSLCVGLDRFKFQGQ